MIILDRVHFDHMTGADRALQVEVVGLFRQQVEGWRGAPTGAAGWRDAVHTLKGSARGIGAFAVAEAAAVAEHHLMDKSKLEPLKLAFAEARSYIGHNPL